MQIYQRIKNFLTQLINQEREYITLHSEQSNLTNILQEIQRHKSQHTGRSKDIQENIINLYKQHILELNKITIELLQSNSKFFNAINETMNTILLSLDIKKIKKNQRQKTVFFCNRRDNGIIKKLKIENDTLMIQSETYWNQNNYVTNHEKITNCISKQTNNYIKELVSNFKYLQLQIFNEHLQIGLTGLNYVIEKIKTELLIEELTNMLNNNPERILEIFPKNKNIIIKIMILAIKFNYLLGNDMTIISQCHTLFKHIKTSHNLSDIRQIINNEPVSPIQIILLKNLDNKMQFFDKEGVIIRHLVRTHSLEQVAMMSEILINAAKLKEYKEAINTLGSHVFKLNHANTDLHNMSQNFRLLITAKAIVLMSILMGRIPGKLNSTEDKLFVKRTEGHIMIQNQQILISSIDDHDLKYEASWNEDFLIFQNLQRELFGPDCIVKTNSIAEYLLAKKTIDNLIGRIIIHIIFSTKEQIEIMFKRYIYLMLTIINLAMRYHHLLLGNHKSIPNAINILLNFINDFIEKNHEVAQEVQQIIKNSQTIENNWVLDILLTKLFNRNAKISTEDSQMIYQHYQELYKPAIDLFHANQNMQQHKD